MLTAKTRVLPLHPATAVTLPCTSRFLPFGAAAPKLNELGVSHNVFLFPQGTPRLHYAERPPARSHWRKTQGVGGCEDVVEMPVHDILRRIT